MKIEKILEKIGNNLPTGVKKAAIEGAFIATILTACGRTVDNTPVTTPAPTTTIEHQVDDPVVDEPVVDNPEVGNGGGETNPTTPVETAPVIENSTFVQTGENEYTVYVDCADNSNAPELETIALDDTLGSIAGNSEEFGISRNLLTAVMTHGIQVDYTNAAQINYDAYTNRVISVNRPIRGNYDYVIADGATTLDADKVYDLSTFNYGEGEPIPPEVYRICAIILKESIVATDGNLNLALTRYNMGPEAWNQVMEECMNATGLTAEQIYASGDAAFVLSYDTLGLGDPNYAGEVLQYIGNEPVTVTRFNASGEADSTTTYTIDRAKAYGQR